MKKHAVIIVAGGSGSRMAAQVPKQFLPLGREQKPVLVHTLERFLHAVPHADIVVVLPAAESQRWRQISARHGLTGSHIVCEGGDSRFESVKNSLPHVSDCRIVAIHDGVRPLVSEELIRRTFEAVEQYGAVVPVIPIADSLRMVDDDGSSVPVDRARMRAVQTPQVFALEMLLNAYQAPYQTRFTDDAAVVEHAGNGITLIEGERSNIKITTAVDLAVAEALLEAGY